jgi:hypothetical protein
MEAARRFRFRCPQIEEVGYVERFDPTLKAARDAASLAEQHDSEGDLLRDSLILRSGVVRDGDPGNESINQGKAGGSRGR